jgi:hypothetical protein
LVGRVFVGGAYHKNTQVTLLDDPFFMDVSWTMGRSWLALVGVLNAMDFGHEDEKISSKYGGELTWCQWIHLDFLLEKKNRVYFSKSMTDPWYHFEVTF